MVESGLNSRKVTIVDVCPRTRASRAAALAGETLIAWGDARPVGYRDDREQAGDAGVAVVRSAARAALFTADGGRPRGSRCTMATPASSG